MSESMTDLFIGYVQKQMARFRKGEDEYNGDSFHSDFTSLLDEIEEEIIDQSNWAFLAYHALQKTRAKFERLQSQINDKETYIENLNKQIADLEDDMGVSTPAPPNS